MQTLFHADAQDWQGCLREGFGPTEDGFAWSQGQGSRLCVPVAPGHGTHWLELSVNPFVAGAIRAQPLSISVNGVPVGEDRLLGEGTLGYRIPDTALQGGTLLVALRHQGACSPASLGAGADRRVLGFMLRSVRVVCTPAAPLADLTVLPPLDVPFARDRMGQAVSHATGLDPEGLVRCFESLGHNCEFGLMQRQLGAEPLDMLRFAGITLDDLLGGLRRGFEGIGEAIDVVAHPTAGGLSEYLLKERRYRIGLHSFRTTAEADAAQVRAEHALRMRFMHRLFLDRLAEGGRVWVFQRPGQMTPSQARPLLTLLRSYGPNALLFVDQSPGLPHGGIEQLDHGLFHGTLARMAPAEDLGSLDVCGWLSLCARTYRLWARAGRA